MRIAVIGAGFCGLAITWHLLQEKNIEVVIFDTLGIAKGTSSIAAGLLHPYAGAYAKRNWQADEGLAATKKLLKVAENFIKFPITKPTGLLRLAVSTEQHSDFLFCSKNYPDAHWKTIAECQNAIKHLNPLPGIFIDSALTVDCANYLQGLWLACKAQDAHLEVSEIKKLDDLKDFDRVIIAAGAATKNLPELNHLPITPIKGQIIEFTWPETLEPLPYAINSQAYLLMNFSNTKCIAGATFERNFVDSKPDITIAMNEILPKIHAFYPRLDCSDVIDCRSGIRASTPGHRPLLLNISEKYWVLTGMGSKGLLYHALFAEKLVRQLVS